MLSGMYFVLLHWLSMRVTYDSVCSTRVLTCLRQWPEATLSYQDMMQYVPYDEENGGEEGPYYGEYCHEVVQDEAIEGQQVEDGDEVVADDGNEVVEAPETEVNIAEAEEGDPVKQCSKASQPADVPINTVQTSSFSVCSTSTNHVLKSLEEVEQDAAEKNAVRVEEMAKLLEVDIFHHVYEALPMVDPAFLDGVQ